MLNKGIKELVAFILGKRNAMVFNHQLISQREQAFLLQHMNIHDTKRTNHHKRNIEFKDLLIHPFEDTKPKRKSLRDVVKKLKNG